MNRRIVLAVFILCLCMSFPSAAYAYEGELSSQEEIFMEESIPGWNTRSDVIPTPTEIYESMIKLKDQEAYKEGIIWTDYEPYSSSTGYYQWAGGTLDGKNISAAGCVAFAFILSDEAFGSLPARMYAAGEITFADIKVGDILRVNNDTHTVIVLEVTDTGVVVAEGNYSGKVHWGRAISKEELMRDLSHYITRYPEDYVSPDDPEANVSIAGGELTEEITWNLTKAGTLTVSGNGVMPDFDSAGDQPWSDNSDKIRKIVIEEGITSIGSCAFWNCGALSVEISSNVTAIGANAFRGSSIISADIPSGVKRIGDSAFRECPNLSSVNISEGVETIGENAFRSCTSLASIVLPASTQEVGAGAFFQCTAMKSAVFTPGSGQVRLGDNLFTQCYWLMSVTLPSHIDRIGTGMFQNCQMLAGMEIPQGVESIGGSAFASCSSFTTVIIPDSVTSIEMAAFSDCPLKDVYYTGSEAQWNQISKAANVAAILSGAAIHYNYTPPAGSDPDDGDDNDGDSGDDENTGSGDGSGDTGNTGSGDGSGDTGNTGSDDGSGNTGNTGSGDGSGDTGNTGSGDGAGNDDSSGSGNHVENNGTTGSGDHSENNGTIGNDNNGSSGSSNSTGSNGNADNNENKSPNTGDENSVFWLWMAEVSFLLCTCAILRKTKRY